MKARNYDLIVFDWDGTLYDSTALNVRSIHEACRDLGAAVPTDTQAAYVIGLGLQDALRHCVPELAAEKYPALGLRYRHHYFERQHALSMFDGTLAMLQALKVRGHALAVATGKGRRGLDEALAHAQLRGLFDATRTADETASKPDPRMLNELMQELGTLPARTLMIGDTTHDLLLARNAGTPRVAVSYGAHEPEAFEAFAPLTVVHSTRELHDWLLVHG